MRQPGKSWKDMLVFTQMCMKIFKATQIFLLFFLLTIIKKTGCNVRGVPANDKPTYNYSFFFFLSSSYSLYTNYINLFSCNEVSKQQVNIVNIEYFKS